MAGLSVVGVWRETRAVVARHRGALMTLGAATVFLPNAALRLLAPAVASPSFDPARPVQVPQGFWLMVIMVIMLQFIGVFAVAAITADAREGGGRTLGQTLAAAIPALGKFLVALLVFFGVYFVGSIVFGLLLAIIVAIWSVASPGLLAGAKAGQPPLALAVLILAFFVPLMIWLWARLAPLVGVYLREPLGVVPGIRRAWRLSRPAVRPLVGLVITYIVAAFAIGAVQVGAASDVGIVSIVVNLLFAALSAVIFVYGAAGTGIVYRELAG
ncbi:hypothetical protein KX816_11970 [Sphingosinicellaceae bacterium]|nr:hypothetical protein KX816_11970 [Sphingosinicellaceae bacterium]